MYTTQDVIDAEYANNLAYQAVGCTPEEYVVRLNGSLDRYRAGKAILAEANLIDNEDRFAWDDTKAEAEAVNRLRNSDSEVAIVDADWWAGTQYCTAFTLRKK